MARRRRKLLITLVIPPSLKFITTDANITITTDSGNKLTTG